MSDEKQNQQVETPITPDSTFEKPPPAYVDPSPSVTGPFGPPILESAPVAQTGMQTSDEPPKRGPGRPRKIVDLEETIKADPSIPEDGVSFFFGEIGVLKFPDEKGPGTGGEYHVRAHRAHITDPKLIEKIRAFAIKNPTHKVFEDQ